MAENVLGLIFEIAADASKATKEIDAFASKLDSGLGLATGKAREYAGQIDKHFGFAEGSILKVGQASMAAGKDLLILGGIAGGVAAGALALANKWAEAGTAIFEASEQTGLAADKLSGLHATAQVLDESTQALDQTLIKMGRNIESGLREPAGAAGKNLQELFKSSDELRRLGLMPLDAQIETVSKKIFGLNSVSQQNIQLAALAGRGYNEVRSTLAELGANGYDPLIERAKRLGQFFDKDSARRARQFRIELRQIKTQMEGMALVAGQALVPTLTQLIALLSVKLGQSFGENAQQSLRDYAAGIFNIAAKYSVAGLVSETFRQGVDRATLAIAGGNEETQKMTDQMVATDAMVRAAAKGTDELGGAQDKTAKATKGFSTDLGALAGIYRELSKEQDPFTQANEEYRQVLMKIAMATGPAYNAFMLEKMALERRDAAILAELAKQQEAVEDKFPKAAPALPAASQLPVIAQWDAARPTLQRTKETAEQVIQRLKVTLPGATSAAALALKELGDAGLAPIQMMDRFSGAMGHAIGQSIVYSKSVGEAVRNALKATLAAIAGEAIVRAIFETAMGIASLASWDFRSAALHFKSAALFGAVGGAAAVAGRAIPGGGEGGGASPYAIVGPGGASSGVIVGPGAGQGPALAPGVPAAQSGAPSGNVTVMIVGEPQGAAYVAGMLNRHVVERDGELRASHAMNPVTAGR